MRSSSVNLFPMKESTVDQIKMIATRWGGQSLMITFSFLKLFAPPELQNAGKEVALNFLNALDPQLLPWVFVLNILGYWLKKLVLPRWMPSMPVIIFMASFVVCCLFGWAHTDAVGAKAMVISIFQYGIGNGIAVAWAAIFGYDVFSSEKKKYLAAKEKKEER